MDLSDWNSYWFVDEKFMDWLWSCCCSWISFSDIELLSKTRWQLKKNKETKKKHYILHLQILNGPFSGRPNCLSEIKWWKCTCPIKNKRIYYVRPIAFAYYPQDASFIGLEATICSPNRDGFINIWWLALIGDIPALCRRSLPRKMTVTILSCFIVQPISSDLKLTD